MSRPRTVLALDIASVSGWAVGPIGVPPLLGSVKLIGKGVEDGAIGAAFIDFVTDHIELFHPHVVAYEAALPYGQHKGAKAGMLAFGLIMLLKVVCWRRGLSCVPGNVSTVRAQVLGNGHAQKSDVVAWVQEQGWRLPEVFGAPDEDAADAAALWAFSSGIRHPSKRRAA
ncbi:MAG: hypothetical protein P4L90_25970 [Rhodopila sp.]|nr:hypothetical protein [Rhodopila sp.]